MSDINKKKFSLYRLLNEGNGKGVKKEEKERKRDLKFYFVLFGRRFGAIVKLNLIWLAANFPIFFALFAASGYAGKQTTAPASVFFSVLDPLVRSGQSNPVIASLFGITGIKGTMFVNTPLTYVMYALGLLTVFTFGPANVGVIYNLRNIVRGEPLFLLSDFRDAVRKNFKQSLIYGIIDALIIGVLIFDIANYAGMMRYIAIAIAVIYMLMRIYIYIMIPTFDLSLYKMFKNALIFTSVNLKRNVLCVIGWALILFINYGLLNVFFPLGAVMPFALTISAVLYTGVYCAWPSIKEIMIDPYTEEKEGPEKKPIFTDRG